MEYGNQVSDFGVKNLQFATRIQQLADKFDELMANKKIYDLGKT